MNAVDDIDPRLDAHIRRTLQEVARTVPRDGDERRPPSLAAVRPPRPWPTWTKVAIVVAVAGLLAAAVVVRQEADDPNVATTPDPEIVQQRLLFEGWPGELRPDGSVVALPLGGLDRLGLQGGPQPLPDGRHVLLGERRSSSESDDGDEIIAPVLHLVVVGADGEVEVDHEIPRAGAASIALLSTTPDEAILARAPDDPRDAAGATQIVAYDLETGQERLVDEGLPAGQTEARSFMAGHVVADTLAVADVSMEVAPGDQAIGRTSCTVYLTDIHTDGSGIAESGRAATPTEPCSNVSGVRLSPDGDLLAFVYLATREGRSAAGELRLAVVDWARSTTLLDESLGCHEPGPCPGEDPVEFVGMAWDEDATLRVALVDLATDPDWNRDGPLTEDDLLVETHTVARNDAGNHAEEDGPTDG